MSLSHRVRETPARLVTLSHSPPLPVPTTLCLTHRSVMTGVAAHRQQGVPPLHLALQMRCLSLPSPIARRYPPSDPHLPIPRLHKHFSQTISRKPRVLMRARVHGAWDDDAGGRVTDKLDPPQTGPAAKVFAKMCRGRDLELVRDG